MKNVKLYLKSSTPSALELTNGDFIGSLGGWTNPGGWSYASGRAYGDYKATTSLSQSLGFTPGVSYKVSIKVIRQYGIQFLVNRGTITVNLGDQSYVISESGEYEFTLNPTTGTTFSISQDYNFRGYVEYVYVESPELNTFSVIDLTGQNVDLNYNIKDIEDISVNLVNYTQELNIIGTKENNQTLNNLWNINIIETDVLFGKTIPAYLEVNDTEILNGLFEVSSATYNEVSGYIDYSGSLYSNSRNIVDLMGNNKLYGEEGLDFSKYDHILNWNTVSATWVDESESTGYYYPIINYGGIQGNIVQLRDLRPALYVNEVWDALFEKYGFTYTSDFLTSDRFNKLILPWTKSPVIDGDSLALRNATVGSYGDVDGIYRLKGIGIRQLPASYSTRETFSKAPLNSDSGYNWSDPGGNFDTSTFTYTVPVIGNYNINYFGKNVLRLYYNNKAANGSYYGTGTIKIYTKIIREVNGVKNCIKATESSIYTAGTSFATKLVPGQVAKAWQFSSYGSINSQFLKTGDKVYIEYDVDFSQFEFYNSGGSLLAPNYFNGDVLVIGLENDAVKTQLQITGLQANSSLWEGDTVSMNQCLPDMTQKEFYKGIIDMFNLYVIEDPEVANNFLIEPRDDFYSQGELVNWTSLLDRNQEVSLSKIDTFKDKNFRITYSDDTDNHNKSYSESTKRNFSQNDIINPSVETTEFQEIVIPFAPTPSDEIQGTNIPIPQIFETGTDNKVLSKTFNPRILNKIIMTSANGWTQGTVKIWSDLAGKYYVLGITTGFAGQGNDRHYVPTASHFDNPTYDAFDLNFGSAYWYYQTIDNNTPTWNGLYNLYWRKTIESMMDPDSRLYSGYFKLDEVEINNFRFNNTIIVDEQEFIVNRIENWNPDQLTKVELLKLKDVILPATDPEKNDDNGWHIGWDRIEWDLPRKFDEKYNPKIWFDKGFDSYTSQQHIKSYVGYESGTGGTEITGDTGIEYGDIDVNIPDEATNQIYDDARGNVIGTNNTVMSAAIDYNVLGKSNIIGEVSKQLLVVGSNNTIEPYVEISTIIGDYNKVKSGTINAHIIGGVGIVNDTDNTTIIGGVSKTQALVSQPDIIDGSYNEVQSPFSAAVANIVDGGENINRPLGAFSITTNIDGNSPV